MALLRGTPVGARDLLNLLLFLVLLADPTWNLLPQRQPSNLEPSNGRARGGGLGGRRTRAAPSIIAAAAGGCSRPKQGTEWTLLPFGVAIYDTQTVAAVAEAGVHLSTHRLGAAVPG